MTDAGRGGPVPMHAPESIQTFGFLLAFREPGRHLERCSANIRDLLGRAPQELVGLRPEDVLPSALIDQIETSPATPSGGTLLRQAFVAPDGTPHSVTVLRTADHLILELEPTDEDCAAIYELVCRVQAGIEILRPIADPQRMLAKIAEIFRDITGFDRVLLFRFDADWNRDIVAEERSPAAPGRFLGLRVPADALPVVARRLYQRAGIRLIPDVRLPSVPIVGVAGAALDGEPLDLSDSCLRATSAEHAAHLTAIGVRASLTIAIELSGHLWGIATAHHYQPRRLSAIRRAACRMLATSIAAPLAALEDTARAADSTRRAIAVARAGGEAIERAGPGGSPLDAFVRHLADVADATAAVLRIGTAEASAGTLPARPLLDRILALAASEHEGGVFATDSLSRLEPSMAPVRDIASGVVSLDLPVPGGGMLLLLRGEIVEEVVWAQDGSQPYSDSGPPWAVAVGNRKGNPPLGGDGAGVQRVRGVARGWSERLLPLLPVARQAVLDIVRAATEREALAAIRRRESELRTIYDSVDEGIALADRTGRILNCNQRFAALLDLPLETVVGQPFDALIEPAGPGSLRLLDGTPTKVRLRGADAGGRALEFRSSPTGQGDGSSWTIVLRDVSQRERFEAELVRAREAAERANRAKDEFLANMSHELRTPLTAVLGYIDLLDQQIRDPTQRKWISTVRRSGWSLLRLLSDIVDFARIDAGEVRLEFGVFDPVAKVHSIIDLFRPTMDQKGIAAEVRVAAGMPRAVVGDQARIRQVLSNLIGNAVKFTREGRITVDIEASAPDPAGQIAMSISVADTGVGIAAKDLGRLFDRFSQADTSSTRPFGGAGLGLAIARGLARRMGGDVTAHSAGPGQGARFRLDLPVRSVARAAPPSPPAAAGTRQHGSVLIIEDDPVNQELLAEMVRVLGFTAELAGTGEQGVAAAAARPDLTALLVDVNLPGINGLEAIRRIRALDPPVSGAPILCITALASDRDRVAALAAGADAYLSKPLRLAELRQTLEREIARRSA
ncbi:hypothetical protein STAQ_01500 [Allostella sp. ATCC 35155]|nr:hypothetical protein STAQ_01500 [Stella sp. ATCC 35155]